MKITWMKKLIKKRRLAVGPVIAVILMIGLTVVAGSAFFVIGNDLLTSQATLRLDTGEPTDYASTETTVIEYDSAIDTFSIQVTNPLTEPIVLELSSTFLYNATDDQILDRWFIDSSIPNPILGGLESTTLEFKTFAGANIDELKAGDDVYIVFSLRRVNDQSSTLLQTETYKVSTASSLPVFHVVGTQTITQNGFTTFFYAADDEEIVTNVSLTLWNEGNPTASHEKLVTIFNQNNSVFSIDPLYESQTVTIPSSTTVGDGGELGLCEAGEACVEIIIPVTKFNLTEKGITRASNQNVFGAILAISGLDFTTLSFELTDTPELFITMPDGKGQKNGGLTFDGKKDKEKDKTLTLIVWNLENSDFTGNIELNGLNTTAFRLDDANNKAITVPTGKIPNKLNKCKNDYACVKLKWDITRFPIEDNNKVSTGILPGVYPVDADIVQNAVSYTAFLYIPKDKKDGGEFHFDSVTWKEKIKNNKVEKIELLFVFKDELGLPIKDMEFEIEYTVNGETDDLKEDSNKDGIVKFKLDKFDMQAGDTITVVIDVLKHKPEEFWSYDSNKDKISFPLTYTITG